jgi:hypothetical protein
VVGIYEPDDDDSSGITDAEGPVTIAHIWSGSEAEYDALESYDADTLYFTPES